MLLKKLLFSALTLTAMSCAEGHPEDQFNVGGEALSGCDMQSHDFDFMLLVMQWPPSDGKMELNHWTLHGLWPSRIGADSDSYPCQCSNQKFDPSKLSDLEDELRFYWPSLFGGNDHFWSHEWLKHGTCAKVENEHDYFKKVLDLRSAFDPKPALTKKGIVPSKTNSYTVAEINAALSKEFGSTPMLGCKRYKGRQELHEVGLCFDSPVPSGYEACDPSIRRNHGEVNDCNASEAIWLPGNNEANTSIAR